MNPKKLSGFLLIFLIVLVFGTVYVCNTEKPQIPDLKNVISLLEKNHPRLMLKEIDLLKQKELLKKDKLLQKCKDDILAKADSYLSAPPLTYKLIGPRLLRVSVECVTRMYTLGLAWRLTGQNSYADKAIENLLAVCNFKDWNPSHFLDTAEMSHAVAIGYDWFFHYLDPEARNKIRLGLIKHGLQQGVAAYQINEETGDQKYIPEAKKRPPNWWATAEMNWNQVCNGGLLIGALAVAETDPEYAEIIVPAAVKNLHKASLQYSGFRERFGNKLRFITNKRFL